MHHKSLFPHLPRIPPQNVHNFILNRPEQADWPDYPLHINALTGTTRSFRQFIETVRDGATAITGDVNLGGLGIQPRNNELVAILSEDPMDCVALIHSLLVTTVPFVILSSYYTPFEFQHSVKLATPTRLFTSTRLLSLALASGLPDDRIYILDGHVPGRVSYGDLVELAQINGLPRLPIQPAQNDTLAYLIFSSGTSGLPKAVMISHGNIIDSLSQMFVFSQELLKVQGPPTWNGPGGLNVILNVLPMHHAYGLHITSIRCFTSPTTVVLLPKWNAEAFFDCIPNYRVTSMFLVPSLVHQIVYHARFPAADFSTVQSIICSAAHLPVSLAEKLRSRFPGVERVGEGYGMSECTLSISMMPAPAMLEGRAKPASGSVGMLMPGVEARVVSEDGQLATSNEPGELYIRSGSVALGYLNNKKATDETFKDGWLRTGDRMRIDADGVVYFEERAKDTLKVSGTQVSPREIEETLFLHPENLIIDVTVAGVSGGRTADERVPRAWVVLSPVGKIFGATKVAARLDVWVRLTLSKPKWLKGGIVAIDQIPKSPTGKVLRRVLVDEYEAGSRPRGARL